MSAGINMTLTLIRRAEYCPAESWNENRNGDLPPTTGVLEPGQTVQYVAHCYGGMVKVIHQGQQVVIHPGATKELS